MKQVGALSPGAGQYEHHVLSVGGASTGAGPSSRCGPAPWASIPGSAANRSPARRRRCLSALAQRVEARDAGPQGSQGEWGTSAGRSLEARGNGRAAPAGGAAVREALAAVTGGRGGPESDDVDVVMLGNLCVDVLVDVEEFPGNTKAEKWAYMQKVKSLPTDESKWEAGGSLNFGIAAARLGLRCSAYGYMGQDKFGAFLERVLQEEGLGLASLTEEDAGGPLGGLEDGYTGETWVCWVLIDPAGNHMFASPFDFNKWAAFSRVRDLPSAAGRLVQQSRSLAINGFAFDEFRPEVVEAAARAAQARGAAVFFDPGPRTRSLSSPEGTAKASFDWLVRESEVLLLTSDEAEVLTGVPDPVASAQLLLASGGPRRDWVVVKRGGEGCVLATAKDGLFTLPGFKVEVADTVGCGDSFAAAVALGYIKGQPPSTTLALANAVGAATATRTGAGRNVAQAARVAEILLGLQAREEGWHGYEEDWDAEVWLEDRGKRFRVGHVGVHGLATCPSGTPLLESVKGAAQLLHDSLMLSKSRSEPVAHR